MKLKKDGLYHAVGMGMIGNSDIKATPTGEYRPPKRGEWYLSGAVIEAYRAPNDLSQPFHIAKLVRTETVTTVIGDYTK